MDYRIKHWIEARDFYVEGINFYTGATRQWYIAQVAQCEKNIHDIWFGHYGDNYTP